MSELGGTGRIAIKFGAPSTSKAPSSSTSKRPNPPPSSLGKRPRANAWGHGSDSEHDSDSDSGGGAHGGGGGGRGKHEAITGFGADGAETVRDRDARPEKKKKEYVIARQPNRDWREEMKSQRRGRNLLPEEARAQHNGHGNGSVAETDPADQDKGIKWGLTVKEKTSRTSAEAENENGDENGAPSNSKSTPSPPPPKRTADDAAMDALLGNGPEKKDLAIIQPPTSPGAPPLTEDDAFRRDMSVAGEASTLADYEDMPVEEFGAALLRGMGWDGKPRGPKPKEVKRRQNRLGLGAKELKEGEDLGGWNQGGGGGKKRSRPRLDEYRREESKRKEGRGREDSYKRERERERDGHGRDRERERDRDRRRDYDRHRDRHRDYDRDRRR